MNHPTISSTVYYAHRQICVIRRKEKENRVIIIAHLLIVLLNITGRKKTWVPLRTVYLLQREVGTYQRTGIDWFFSGRMALVYEGRRHWACFTVCDQSTKTKLPSCRTHTLSLSLEWVSNLRSAVALNVPPSSSASSTSSEKVWSGPEWFLGSPVPDNLLEKPPVIEFLFLPLKKLNISAGLVFPPLFGQLATRPNRPAALPRPKEGVPMLWSEWKCCGHNLPSPLLLISRRRKNPKRSAYLLEWGPHLDKLWKNYIAIL